MNIRIIGEINEEAYEKFVETVLAAPRKVKFHVSLMSEGGSATVALAFHDFIKRHEDRFIVCIGTGIIASAAALVFVSFNQRQMTKNSWFMVHEDSLSGIDDKMVHQIEKILSQSRQFENQWNSLMAECTCITKNQWEIFHKNETYFTAEECLELQIVGKIV